MQKPKPTTVLHVITRMVDGGAQRVVLDCIRVLAKHNWRVVLAVGPETGPEGSLLGEAESLLRKNGGKLATVPALRRSALRPFHDILAIQQIRGLIHTHKPVLIHAHTSKAGMLGCIAGRLSEVPAVLAPHGHFMAQDASIPGVPSGGLGLWVLSQLLRFAASSARVVVAPNSAEMREGVDHRLWTPSKARVVPNGIDTDLFVPRPSVVARTIFGLPLDVLVVGVVARLSREKGVDLAIEAFASLTRPACSRKMHLAIVGDGQERAALTRLVNKLGIANCVTFLGRVPHSERFYPAIDLLLVPSRTEAHGLVATEAMSCGKPVVAARVGGLASLLSEGNTGLYYPTGDVPAMASAVEAALRREWSADICRKWATDHWSVIAMGRELQQVYCEILGTCPEPVPAV